MANSILISAIPCKKCGTFERDQRRDCVVCKKARDAVRYAENKLQRKSKDAAYYAKNSAKIRARHAEYHIANIAKIKKKDAVWYAANPEAVRIKAQNRRAMKKAAGGKLSKGLATKLFELQKGKCPCCKQPLGKDYHLDHIVPLALGGPNTDDNMQLLRQRCNNQKHAKHPIDFMQQRGFLL